MQQQTAILYARLARKQTAIRDMALQVQEESLRQYCKENNIKVMVTYHDIASGNSFDRLAFIELLHFAECNRGKINLLLITEWSRFSRDASEAISMERKLNEMGISVIAVNQPVSPAGQQFFNSLNNLL